MPNKKTMNYFNGGQ